MKMLCNVEECDKKIYGKTIYCNRHYQQIKRYGKIFRSIYDPNKIIIEENIAKIELYDKPQNIVGYAIIDIEDVEKIKNYKWTLSKNGYISSNTSKENYLHRLIMNNSLYKNIDHINQNKFDNRKINLRECNYKENGYNRNKTIENTSGFKGVTFNKKAKKWVSQIMVNYKHIHLGYFTNSKDAAIAYNEGAIKYHGEFACLNEILKDK
jgi:hypothetical protein